MVFPPPFALLLLPETLITVLAAIAATIRPLPAPRGSPVTAGLSPILEISWSAFLAVFAIPTTSRHQGSTIAPDGIAARAESINFRNNTFITIITIIEMYVRINPTQISFVDLLPPIASPTGQSRVRTATTTYLSAISKNSFIS